jgi:hypothetical protein
MTAYHPETVRLLSLLHAEQARDLRVLRNRMERPADNVPRALIAERAAVVADLAALLDLVTRDADKSENAPNPADREATA